MRLRFKTLLVIIFILILSCVSIRIGYFFYDKIVNNPLVVVDGNITINFLKGNEFKTNKDNTLEFSVTNNSEEDAYYYIQISEAFGKATYELVNESKSLKVSDDLKSDIISNYISISGNDTDNYTINFSSSGEEYSGIINVGINMEETKSFAEIILSNNKVNNGLLSKMGENATESEGLLESTDDSGVAYYFRGNITNNYAILGDLTWRIVKINGDGSVKLVLNTITSPISKYYDDGTNFQDSTVYTYLNNWYESNLKDYSDYITNYRFCNDSVTTETESSFIAYNRIAVDKIPTYVCLGTKENNKIGLLTADEVMMAGASFENNTSYYLYSSEIDYDYYTMTSARKTDSSYNPFVVTRNGALSYSTEGKLLRGVRPVINIVRNVGATGTGTVEDPYVINTTKSN